MTAAAFTPYPSKAYPVIGSLRGPSIDETADFEPQVDSARFITPVIEDHATAVVRLRGEDLDCGALRCTTTTAGYRVELLPTCTRQGDELLVGVRIYREASARGLGCEVRFSAGVTAVHAIVMVR